MSQSKQRILTASGELFSELGYDRVTIEKIASAAAVSKATIYKNFVNKDQILSDYIALRITNTPQEIRDIVDSSAPLEYFLPKFAEEYIVYISNPDVIDVFKIFIGFAGRVALESRSCFHLLPSDTIELLTQKFEFWCREGHIVCADTDLLVSQFLGMTRGVVYPRIVFDPSFRVDRSVARVIANQATSVLLHGVEQGHGVASYSSFGENQSTFAPGKSVKSTS